LDTPRPPLRIGVLGAARIAPRAVIDPARVTGHRVVAVAARDPERARAFADVHGIERVHQRYADLVDDPEIDVVYNALHNAGHAPWNIMALEAGKHVLSEKPSASNSVEAAEVVRATEASGKVFLEGFHYLYHPAIQRVLELARGGNLGSLVEVTSSLVTAPPPPDDLRWSFELAGGSLMDLGCYSLHVQRMAGLAATGDEPTVVGATARARPDGVDAAMDVALQHADGAQGTASGDFEAAGYAASLVVRGTDASVEVPSFVAPGRDDRVVITEDGRRRTEHHGSLSTFTYQLIAMADAIQLGTPLPIDAADALIQAQAIDRAYELAGLPLRPSRALDHGKSGHR